MLEAANKDKEMLSVHIGSGTRVASDNRDITGSLAHQAVENCMTDHDVEYQSSRTRLNEHGGDKWDILYENDLVDVKGCTGELKEQYHYNIDCLVMKAEVDTIKAKGITHFVFVKVDEPNKLTHILGAITSDEFFAKATDRPSPPLPFPALGVPSRLLTSLPNYINRWRQL
jgi:hypothetical protein